MKLIYDENVQGEVYIQDKWPKLRYFKDWGVYTLNNYKVAVVGGAYSVDKFYRLQHNFRWFEDEQLDIDEMIHCTRDFTNLKVDFIFSHTCPVSWEPTDMFLTSVDQSTVDKSMELFLDELAKVFDWNIWCFGHYHADRIERPHVEQFFQNIENLNDITTRWNTYDKTGSLNWWLQKSTNFYRDDIINPHKVITHD